MNDGHFGDDELTYKVIGNTVGNTIGSNYWSSTSVMRI